MADASAHTFVSRIVDIRMRGAIDSFVVHVTGMGKGCIGNLIGPRLNESLSSFAIAFTLSS
jgi:hypothetical protein